MTESQVSLGSGSSENIRTVIQMLQNQALMSGKKLQVIVPHPTFAYAELYATSIDVAVVKVASPLVASLHRLQVLTA